MKDVIRVAAAVPEVKPGNVTFNLEQTKKYIARAREAGVRVLVMPELGLTGYSCGDLFFSQRLQEAVANAIAELEHETVGITVAVGAPIHTEGRLFNCALLYSDGRLVGVVPKMYLPNYGEFAEKRFFSPGLGAHTHTVRLLGRDIPFGKGLVFRDCNGLGLGIEICEDFWAPIPPSTMLALGGANIILNLSASTTMAAKHLYRRSLVTDMSARLMAMYVYTSSGYSESTADYVCCGYSAIASGGVLLAENEKYIDGDYMIYADSDLGCCRAERQRIDRFGDCVADSDACSQVRTVVLDNSFTCENAPCDRMKISPYPFIPSDEKERRERVAQVYELQCAALARRMKQTGCRPVIGVSGGLDSTLALMVAIGASERLGKGADYVLGLTMPCFGTSGATYKNSLALMESLKIESLVLDSKNNYVDNGSIITTPDKLERDLSTLKRFGVMFSVIDFCNLRQDIEKNYFDIPVQAINLTGDARIIDLIDFVKEFVSGNGDLIDKSFCYVPVSRFNELAEDCGYLPYEMRTLRSVLANNGYIRENNGRYTVLHRISGKVERTVAFNQNKLNVPVPEKKATRGKEINTDGK